MLLIFLHSQFLVKVFTFQIDNFVLKKEHFSILVTHFFCVSCIFTSNILDDILSRFPKYSLFFFYRHRTQCIFMYGIWLNQIFALGKYFCSTKSQNKSCFHALLYKVQQNDDNNKEILDMLAWYLPHFSQHTLDLIHYVQGSTKKYISQGI